MLTEQQTQILKDLESKHPDFKFSEEIFQLTDIPALETRKILLDNLNNNKEINIKNRHGFRIAKTSRNT